MNILKNLPTQTGRVHTTWETIKTNWFIGLVHKFILILFVVSVGFLLWHWTSLPPLVPIWYSRPWGADQLAPPLFLWILPVGSLVLYGVNFLIAVYVSREYLIFTQMLYLSSLIVSVLSCIALIKILYLVA
jgi:hypothetical protein